MIESDESIEKMLNLYGWEVECWSPFEIRTRDGSFATGEAAKCVLWYVRDEHEKNNDIPEPCKSMPHEGQEEIILNGNKFMADKEMIPLLKELNEVGLRTYSHCQGHEGENNSWIVLWADNIENIELRTHETGKKQLLIGWKRKKSIYEEHAERLKKLGYCKQCQYPYHDGLCECKNKDDDSELNNIRNIAELWYEEHEEKRPHPFTGVKCDDDSKLENIWSEEE